MQRRTYRLNPSNQRQKRALRRAVIGHLSRRPEGLLRTIQHKLIEDHYLRVVTDEAGGMTLRRKSDATRDLAGTDGMRIQKMLRISARTVDKIRQKNRKCIFRTKDKTNIPVGRSFARGRLDTSAKRRRAIFRG